MSNIFGNQFGKNLSSLIIIIENINIDGRFCLLRQVVVIPTVNLLVGWHEAPMGDMKKP